MYGGPPGGYGNPYPPQSMVYSTRGGMPPPQMGFTPPSTNFQNNWYARYYNQLQANELHEISNWFMAIDRDRNGSITANEVAQITFSGVPLGIEVARRLVRVFDKDRSGFIDFHEYACMHKFMSTLQTAFFAADRDRSGRIDLHEIHTALGVAGFQLSQPAILSLMRRFDTTGYAGITFRDFLMMGSAIAQAKSLFLWRDPRGTGRLTVDFNQLCELIGELG